MQGNEYGIEIIDTGYIKKRLAGSYLMREAERALFIETGTSESVNRMMKTLEDRGISPSNLDYAIISHIHLDHSAGSGELLKICPNARLICHPRGARHMGDPRALIQSAMEVYGEEKFHELYGEITPVPVDRIETVEDGASIEFGERKLTFLHTRGHANHHICIYDSKSNGVFTGDSFGIAYKDLQVNGLFIYWTASPTQFDPAEARITIDRILETGADRAYLTHFGMIEGLESAAKILKEDLDFLDETLDAGVRSGLEGDDLYRFFMKPISDHLDELYREANGFNMPEEHRQYVSLDAELNARGLMVATARRRQ